MKKFINLSLFISFLFMSCSGDDMVFGSGRPVTETRSVASFSKVKSEGVFDVIIMQGETQSLQITADDNVMALVKAKVVDNELQLSLKNDGYHGVTLKAQITVPRLNKLTNSGKGNIEAMDFAEDGNFRIVNSGTGDIRLTGSATSLSIYNEGTGKINGFEFMVKSCAVENVGSGNIEVNCSENLKVEIEGSGKVFYKGSPTIEIDVTGSGSVISAN